MNGKALTTTNDFDDVLSDPTSFHSNVGVGFGVGVGVDIDAGVVDDSNKLSSIMSIMSATSKSRPPKIKSRSRYFFRRWFSTFNIASHDSK